MALEQQVSAARKLIYRDGYDMSFGELSRLYEKNELIMYPEYQRLFRWNETQRTRFLESLLLNVPIPPIFVFAQKNGVWELVDGLQRVCTVLEFMGMLKNYDGTLRDRFVCDGTTLLPDLKGKRWPIDGEPPAQDHLSQAMQIYIQRARLRVEILGQETDANTKFELFQRLNSGGTELSEQEIRNCIIVSLNPEAARKINSAANFQDFVEITGIGSNQIERQARPEMVVRFIVLRNKSYLPGMDVHEYLSKSVSEICVDETFDWDKEIKFFDNTMKTLRGCFGDDVFKKNNRFSIAFFEFISLGVSKYIERSGSLIDQNYIADRIRAIPSLSEAEQYTGIGIRGTLRLSKFVLPLAESQFAGL